MSGFVLTNSTMDRIHQELPKLDHLNVVKLTLTPDFISTKFKSKPESTVPIAAVCLQDAFDTLFAARYALGELYAHRIWYQEESENPNEVEAVFFSRFYAEDTALRLYSAGEHLANAIVFMLEISDQQLDKYKTHKTSQQSIVGSFLTTEKPNHPATKAVVKLAQLQEWNDTITYRNRLVHEQPPTIKGLGIVYKRSIRWKVSGSGREYRLEIGGGDEPEYSIDDLLGFIKPALFAFTDTMTTIVEYYIELLNQHGIQLKDGGLDIHL